jgi:predicted dehydrogenase
LQTRSWPRSSSRPAPSPSCTTATSPAGSALTEGATAPGVFKAEIHGKNISAYVDAERQSSIVADNGEPEVFEARSFTPEATDPNYWLGFWHETRYFIDCVKEGRQPHCNIADAVKSWELIERIYEAGR